MVFGGRGGASGVPANTAASIDKEHLNKFAASQQGIAASIDRDVDSIGSGIQASPDRSSDAAAESSCAELPSPGISSLQRAADGFQKAIKPINALSSDKPTVWIQTAQAKADELHGALAKVAKQDATGSVNIVVREATAKVETVRAALKECADDLTPQVSRHPATAPSVRTEDAEGRTRLPGTSFLVTEALGDRETARVWPEPGPTTLLVASSPYGAVRYTGLGRLFPAHTIHAKDCGAVVDGNHCRVTSTEHVHIRTVSVDFAPLTKPGSPGETAVADLVKNPTAAQINKFQGTMRQLAGRHEQGETQASFPVAGTHVTVVDRANVVQQGNGSSAKLNSHYVIEEVKLPACELLAANRELAVSFIDVVGGPSGVLKAANFGRDVLRAARRTEDIALVDYSAEVHGVESSVFAIFGIDRVKGAAAAMIGDGNQVRTDLRVDPSEYILHGGLAGLDQIRARVGPHPQETGRHEAVQIVVRPPDDPPSPVAPGIGTTSSPGGTVQIEIQESTRRARRRAEEEQARRRKRDVPIIIVQEKD
jgi:hypothetical protein